LLTWCLFWPCSSCMPRSVLQGTGRAAMCFLLMVSAGGVVRWHGSRMAERTHVEGPEWGICTSACGAEWWHGTQCGASRPSGWHVQYWGLVLVLHVMQRDPPS
jgi:hypothetical protein